VSTFESWSFKLIAVSINRLPFINNYHLDYGIWFLDL